MAVRHSPSATAGLRQGILVNVKARISVGILDKRQNMLEQFFLSLCFLARSTGAAFRSQKVHPVHMESHRTQDNVHTLLDGMRPSRSRSRGRLRRPQGIGLPRRTWYKKNEWVLNFGMPGVFSYT